MLCCLVAVCSVPVHSSGSDVLCELLQSSTLARACGLHLSVSIQLCVHIPPVSLSPSFSLPPSLLALSCCAGYLQPLSTKCQISVAGGVTPLCVTSSPINANLYIQHYGLLQVKQGWTKSPLLGCHIQHHMVHIFGNV